MAQEGCSVRSRKKDYICIFLCLCLSRIAALSKRQIEKTKIYVISHHKSGTIASLQLVAALCECTDATPTEYQFWKDWKRGCFANCQKRGILFKFNGWLGWRRMSGPSVSSARSNDDAGSISSGKSRKRNGVIVVHFVRHPRDMIVSGYLYHRRCAEKWDHQWSTRESATTRYPPTGSHIGFKAYQNGAYAENYCKFLRAAPYDFGVSAEAVRTLEALDGVGNMIKVHSAFRKPDTLPPNSTLHTVCLSSINPLTRPRDEYTKVWHRLAADLDIPLDTINAKLVHDLKTIDKHSTATAANEAVTLKNSGNTTLRSVLAVYADLALRLYYNSVDHPRGQNSKDATTASDDDDIDAAVAVRISSAAKNTKLAPELLDLIAECPSNIDDDSLVILNDSSTLDRLRAYTEKSSSFSSLPDDKHEVWTNDK